MCPMTAPMLTIHDVASNLNVDERTVRELIRKNELRAIKIGKEWRVTEGDLNAYVDGHANCPAINNAQD
jgi:excisionase family DNA binding protein